MFRVAIATANWSLVSLAIKITRQPIKILILTTISRWIYLNMIKTTTSTATTSGWITSSTALPVKIIRLPTPQATTITMAIIILKITTKIILTTIMKEEATKIATRTEMILIMKEEITKVIILVAITSATATNPNSPSFRSRTTSRRTSLSSRRAHLVA